MSAYNGKLDKRWVVIDGSDTLPPPNTIVMVRCENGRETIDYRKPESTLHSFTRYSDVVSWRYLNDFELNEIVYNHIHTDNRTF